MPIPSTPMPAGGSLPLGVLTAVGLLCILPCEAQAGPSATVADCLRPPQALATAASPVLLPPGGSAPQLLAQALPEAAPTRASQLESNRPSRTDSPLLAQAIAPQPESLPACTYDPPEPAIIRGLW